jgi:hypothetical protein
VRLISFKAIGPGIFLLLAQWNIGVEHLRSAIFGFAWAVAMDM